MPYCQVLAWVRKIFFLFITFHYLFSLQVDVIGLELRNKDAEVGMSVTLK